MLKNVTKTSNNDYLPTMKYLMENDISYIFTLWFCHGVSLFPLSTNNFLSVCLNFITYVRF